MRSAEVACRRPIRRWTVGSVFAERRSTPRASAIRGRHRANRAKGLDAPKQSALPKRDRSRAAVPSIGKEKCWQASPIRVMRRLTRARTGHSQPNWIFPPAEYLCEFLVRLARIGNCFSLQLPCAAKSKHPLPQPRREATNRAPPSEISFGAWVDDLNR